MANFCLIKEEVSKFLTGLRDGSIDPGKLADMSSEDRHNYLAKFVGEDNATGVNSLFESKLLLENQKSGMISWAKRVSGITTQTRKDLLTKIEGMDKVLNPKDDPFLHDLAETKLGVAVSQDEAKHIFDLSKVVQDNRAKITDSMKNGSQERIDYGIAKVLLGDYVSELKLSNKSSSIKQYLNPLKVVSDVSGLTKSVLASFDNSFFGRQGVKTLLDLRTSPIWVKGFAKSFLDAGKELAGHDAMLPIKADVFSRPNALNGKYKAMGLDIGLSGEEAYPTALPGKIPVLGRLYKASESAFNGAALRMRADLADKAITAAERHGQNMLDPKEAQSVGKLVNSITGRGSTGLTASQSKVANNMFFSLKFLKANFDTLTAHATDPNMTGYAKKEAAKNLLSIVATLAGVNLIASQLQPGSTESDPNSPNFGKIKIFGQWTDISGGMTGLAHLAAVLTPQQRNGQWGFYTKSGKTGVVSQLNSGKYGAQTALDSLINFGEGKLSPMAGILRDIWTNQNYQGQQPTVTNEVLGGVVPLPGQTFNNLMKDPNSTNVLGSMILDGLGFSVNPSTPQQQGSDWSQNTTKEQSAFLQSVGQDKFAQANQDFNTQYNDWLNTVKNSQEFKSLSPQDQKSLLTTKKTQLEQQVFKDNGFTYQRGTPATKSDQVKNLLDGKVSDASGGLQQYGYTAPTSAAQNIQDLTQSIIDKFIPTAHASDGSVPDPTQNHGIGEDILGHNTTSFMNGQETDTHTPGLIENAANFVGKNIGEAVKNGGDLVHQIFNNGKVSPISGDSKPGSNEAAPAPVQAPPTDHLSGVQSQNPAPIDNGKVDFTKFPNDQAGAKRKDFQPTQPPPDIASIIKKYFPDNYSQAVLVANTENAQYDPSRPDNVNPKDGSHDRGIFQINSNTFNGLMQRAGDKLKQAGINSYDDMYDPNKNAYVASLIQQGAKQYSEATDGKNPNGWGGWFGWQDTGYNLNNGWYSAPDRIKYEVAK